MTLHHPIHIISKDGLRQAILTDAVSGVGTTVSYYRAATSSSSNFPWLFDHQSHIPLPRHVALDLAHRIINDAPPHVGR